MQDPSALINSTESLSRGQAYDFACALQQAPSNELVQKLFYALDLRGQCSWQAIVDFIRNHSRPDD